MYTLLLLAVLLTFLLEPVAATNPIMDQAMSVSSMDLESVCDFCAPSLFECTHYVAASMLHVHPEPFFTPPYELHQPETDLTLIFQYVNATASQPLRNENVQHINTNETTVQSTTVLEHVKDTYTPGDRLGMKRRKPSQRRQASRNGGFPCDAEGCEKVFDRACERTRHQKIHLDRSERPHKCPSCDEGFLYPKDLDRHQRTHIEQPSDKLSFFCRLPGCGNAGFSRRDNLLRHQRTQHRPIEAVA